MKRTKESCLTCKNRAKNNTAKEWDWVPCHCCDRALGLYDNYKPIIVVDELR